MRTHAVWLVPPGIWPLALLLVGACGKDATEPAALSVETVTVSPGTVVLAVGQTQQLTAVTRDSSGNELSGRTVSWSTSDTVVATVSGSGIVTARSGGTATITAASEGKSGTAAVASKAFSALTNGVAAAVPAIPVGGAEYYTILVPYGRLSLRVRLMPAAWPNGVGDANLAVYANPSLGTPVCSSTWEGADECVITAPTARQYAIQVSARTASEGYRLSATSYANFSVDTIASTGYHACALIAGATWCWGANLAGQLGNGTDTLHVTPVPVAGAPSFTSITAGQGHTCGLTATGAAWCWGANNSAQLGDGTDSVRRTPVPVAGGFTFASLDAGSSTTCGLTAGGVAYCWGGNTPTPTVVPGGFTFASVSAGYFHSCALTSGGAAYCWGDNFYGELGDSGVSGYATVPVAVRGGLTFASISAGALRTCGVTTVGAAWCWGANYSGALGNGTTNWSNFPVPVAGGLVFASIRVGDYDTCGVTTDGSGYCWGWNGNGEVGDGTGRERHVPTAVAGARRFTNVETGSYHTCGRDGTGAVYCWGWNGDGQLGDGTIVNHLTPQPVLIP